MTSKTLLRSERIMTLISTTDEAVTQSLGGDGIAAIQEQIDRVSLRAHHSGQVIVALTGATGSGKSSLFNVLVGDPVARIGARRPTTALPMAAVWGDDFDPLLDDLGISARHQVRSTAPNYDELQGLVLLDLPDVDSFVAEHREEALRVLSYVDVVIWVTDPQKYADSVIHEEIISEEYFRHLPAIAVLNQRDKLNGADLGACRADLAALLEKGLSKPISVITTSAIVHNGGDQLVNALKNYAKNPDIWRKSAQERLQDCGDNLHREVGAQPLKELSTDTKTTITETLVKGAGLPARQEILTQSLTRRSRKKLCWPVFQWFSASSPPLELPPPSFSRPHADMAFHTAIAGLQPQPPVAWLNAMRDAANETRDPIFGNTSRAVEDMRVESLPAWMNIWRYGQLFLVALAAVAIVLAGLQFAGIFSLSTFPYALVIAIVCLVAGLGLGLFGRYLAGKYAQNAAADQAKVAREKIADEGVAVLCSPILDLVSRHNFIYHCAEQLQNPSSPETS